MPVLTARGAGVRQGRGWLFRDLDVTVEAGEVVAVVGPPGSGRTTALLALARRFKISAGTIELSGPAALGHVPGVQDVEPVFTVAEHVAERLVLLGRSRRGAGAVELHGLDPAAKGRELTPYQKQVLGLILAGLSGPAVIAFDGVDAGLNAQEQAALWRLVGDLAERGTAVIMTARELPGDSPVTVIRLADEPGLPPTSEIQAAPDPKPDPGMAAESTGGEAEGKADAKGVER